MFDHLAHAISFDSIEEAEEAFPNWWKNFVYGHSNYADDYDLSTLAIRKISFSTKKKLTV